MRWVARIAGLDLVEDPPDVVVGRGVADEASQLVGQGVDAHNGVQIALSIIGYLVRNAGSAEVDGQPRLLRAEGLDDVVQLVAIEAVTGGRRADDLCGTGRLLVGQLRGLLSACVLDRVDEDAQTLNVVG